MSAKPGTLETKLLALWRLVEDLDADPESQECKIASAKANALFDEIVRDYSTPDKP